MGVHFAGLFGNAGIDGTERIVIYIDKIKITAANLQISLTIF